MATPIKPWDVIKSVFSFFLSPINAFIDLFIQLGSIAYLGRTEVEKEGKKKWIWEWSNPYRMRGQEPGPDSAGAFFPRASTVSRIFALIAATLCLLGFIGALAVPIPGVAPLYAASVGMIFKAWAVMSGWTMAARGIGAVLACPRDYRQLEKGEGAQALSGSVLSPLPERILKTFFNFTLFGGWFHGFMQIKNRYVENRKKAQEARKAKRAYVVTSDVTIKSYLGKKKLRPIVTSVGPSQTAELSENGSAKIPGRVSPSRASTSGAESDDSDDQKNESGDKRRKGRSLSA